MRIVLHCRCSGVPQEPPCPWVMEQVLPSGFMEQVLPSGFMEQVLPSGFMDILLKIFCA